MKPQRMTQRTPTAPGLYWFTLDEGCVLRYCRVVERHGVLRLGTKNVDDSGDFAPVARLTHRWWAGPLPEPKIESA
jgi:hypothetical protein